MGSDYGKHMSDIILGGQDGLVNVLGITMGVATAAPRTELVLLSGIAATVAESISMAAVAYTSTSASIDYEHMKANQAGMNREDVEKTVKLLSGHLAQEKIEYVHSRLIVHRSDKPHELPMQKAVSVGFSTLLGSAVPLLPYFIMPVHDAIIVSVLLSALVLFGTGVLKARLMKMKNWKRSGAEILLVGGLAAAAGYLLGYALRIPV